jgi:hypothetical protein
VVQVTRLLDGEGVPVDATGDRKRRTTSLMAAAAQGHVQVRASSAQTHPNHPCPSSGGISHAAYKGYRVS